MADVVDRLAADPGSLFERPPTDRAEARLAALESTGALLRGALDCLYLVHRQMAMAGDPTHSAFQVEFSLGSLAREPERAGRIEFVGNEVGVAMQAVGAAIDRVRGVVERERHATAAGPSPSQEPD